MGKDPTVKDGRAMCTCVRVRARACLRVLRMGEGIPSEAGCQLHSSMRVQKGRQAGRPPKIEIVYGVE